MGDPLPIFLICKQTFQFLQQINVKNVHKVYGAGIQTHNLQSVSLFPNHWIRAPKQGIFSYNVYKIKCTLEWGLNYHKVDFRGPK